MRDGGVLTLDAAGFETTALVTLLLAVGSVGAGSFLWVRASDVGNRRDPFLSLLLNAPIGAHRSNIASWSRGFLEPLSSLPSDSV